MERLGLGPDVCLARNPKLIFGRMTGWGQTGSMASAAGHDINYISLSGALHAIGPQGQNPVPPLNLVGDFGGGGMLLAFGIAAALYETEKSGQGQVIDAAMTDGSALLMNAIFGIMNDGNRWSHDRGTNLLDGGAHFYGTYETADGKWISIGSIEPQFYALLLEKAEITDPLFQAQQDQQAWPTLKEKLAELFIQRTREQWCVVMEGTDICFAPVLDLGEAPNHPHNKARNTYVEFEGVLQPSPAPRFSRTHSEIQSAASLAGEHSEEILSDWGYSDADIQELKNANAI